MMDNHTDHVINEITNFQTFCNVYKIYSYPPYNEKWSEEEIKQEFLKIIQNGVLFGYFIGDKCIGILALRSRNQPLVFQNGIKAIYLSDLAILYEYNKTQAASKLVEFAINYSKENGYSKIYLRTLKDHSSIEFNVFKKAGFRKLQDVIQIVKKQRTRLVNEEDCRFFWQLDII